MKNIPIIYLHYGRPWFLKMAIDHTRRTNSDVHLITDVPEPLEGVNVVDVASIGTDEKPLRKMYKHMNDNNPQIEFICMSRWFLMRDYLRKNNIKEFFYCDTDVILFRNVKEVIPEGIDMAYLINEYQENYRWSTSGHCSYFTLEALERLCDFFVRCYTEKPMFEKLKEKYRYHIRNSRGGGVCDMTILYLFSLENEVYNLLEVHNGSAFDDNVNVDENYKKEEYKMGDKVVEAPNGQTGHIRTKDFQFNENGIPHIYNNITKEDVAFNSLHFQGASGAKFLIAEIFKQFNKKEEEAQE